MKSLTIHLVLQHELLDGETPIRAYARKSKAQEYAGLRRRVEEGVHGRKGFRVVTVPLFVDPSSPAGSVMGRPGKEATK